MLDPFKTVQVESVNINSGINHKGCDGSSGYGNFIPASYIEDRVF